MDLSIITVNYNSLSYLRECVSSIYHWTHGTSFEIIVVDNASPTEDIDRLAEEFPQVKIVKSQHNLGFAGANNLGFRYSSGDWILFLNPDTKLIKPALTEILEQARLLTDTGIVGCRLLNADLSVQTSSIMNFPRIMNSMLQLEYLRLRWPKLWGIGPLFSGDSRPIRVEAVSGACMFIKREIFSRVGMFSEDYFMYSEDIDLCYRVAHVGLVNYYLGQCSIIHYGGSSSVGDRQTVMKTKAELQFVDKNYARPYALAFRASLALTALMRLAAVFFMRCCGPTLVGRNRLASARARWTTVLKTLVGNGPSATRQKPRNTSCRPTNA